MSFHTIPNYKQKKYKLDRKEQDSSMVHHFLKHKFSSRYERASLFTSRGSITLEAAMVIPIFFFSMLCMIYLFEIMSIQSSMESALYSVGRELAQEAYSAPVISVNHMEKELVSILGEEKLDKSIIANGSEGLDCKQSKRDITTACMDLYVRYRIAIPIFMFHIPIRTYEEHMRVKGWTGNSKNLDMALEYDMVYVTDYGLVYHRSINCGYLELSIHGTPFMGVESLRNQSGERYVLCEKCGDIPAGDVVYITDYGSRYHTSLDCQGLKRNIYVVLLKDVNGLGGCLKCAN